MERHSRSFFGQKIGMLFDSGSWDYEYVYLTFLKKLESGTWEKPSKGKGKKIKINLGEQILIAKVLSGELPKWNAVHSFKEQTTSISVNRDEKEGIWIRVGSYRKRLVSPETDILLKLMEHIINEKIMYATGNNYTEKEEDTPIEYSEPAKAVMFE
jgi:hypothetical protein